jgi:hypothetical protein
MITGYQQVKLIMVLSMVMSVLPRMGLSSELENFALHKPATGNGGTGQGNYDLLTDGDTEKRYLGGPTEVQVDLEEIYTFNIIKIWHYWLDGRAYHDNKVAISEKDLFRGEEVVVFDSRVDGEYPETATGKTIMFKPTKARYIRAWVNGSTANKWSHWVEIQAFYDPKVQPVGTGKKLSAIWGRLKSKY